MKCISIIKRNKYALERLCEELGIEKDVNQLLQVYVSVFVSYEKDRERLRVIGVPAKDFSPVPPDEKKKIKRETLAFIGKRVLKKMGVGMEVMKLKAELFCKLWQQTKALSLIERQEESVQNYNITLEKITGEKYL